jgi:hypothetical protein
MPNPIRVFSILISVVDPDPVDPHSMGSLDTYLIRNPDLDPDPGGQK